MRRQSQEPARPPRSHHSLGYDLFGALIAGALVVVFALLLLKHNAHFFWTDDYQISILPVFEDVARSWSEGHWPLLSPYSWVCSNLAGEFQYGTFSLVVNAAVIAIWKCSLNFAQEAAALSITHLALLAMGGYLLARGRSLARPLAIFVGLVASLNGWMICWGASDWFGALAAFTWLPWSWWALEKCAAAEGRRWRVLWPAPFIYLLVAGGFPYTILMLAVVTAWLALQALVNRRDWLALVRLGVGWLFGLGLSAPAWIALLDYAPGSLRSVETFLPHQWQVPLNSLPGLLLPSWTVSWRLFDELRAAHPAIELTCGLAPIVILCATVLAGKKKILAALRWDLALLLVALGLCMVPSAGMFRFSFRWLALFHLVLALSAAEALRRWQEERGATRSWSLGNPGAWALLLVGMSAAASFGFGLTSNNSSGRLLAVSLGASALWWLGDRWLHRRAAVWLPAAVVFATSWATYTTLDAHSTTARFDFTEQLRSPAPLDPARLYLSLYLEPQTWYRADMTGAPYGNVTRPGSLSMFARVHLINGYSPVEPAGVARLFNFRTHGYIEPATVEEKILPECGPDGLLAQLGIDGLIVARDFPLATPLPPNEWKLVHSEWEGDVYHRVTALAPVRVLEGDATVTVTENNRAEVVAEIMPNDTKRALRVIFSRPYFPGYHARLNGVALPVSSLRGLAPTVEIPAGQRGRLEVVYRPRCVTLGGAIAGVTLLLGGLGYFALRETTSR
ncbi:MAG: hypothetical protein M3Y86_08270 [Verrucomicrobiota bacterium]|nr:hypothetical protein [Verrucomicrobiota bacterium]